MDVPRQCGIGAYSSGPIPYRTRAGAVWGGRAASLNARQWVQCYIAIGHLYINTIPYTHKGTVQFTYLEPGQATHADGHIRVSPNCFQKAVCFGLKDFSPLTYLLLQQLNFQTNINLILIMRLRRTQFKMRLNQLFIFHQAPLSNL